jgi:acetyl esterase/lipase
MISMPQADHPEATVATENSRSRQLVDPELLDLLGIFPSAPITATTLPEIRKMAREPFPVDFGTPDVPVAESHRLVPGPEGAPQVGVRIYRPEPLTGEAPCIFHIHGGGYVLGETEALAPMHRKLSADVACVLVTVEYRLAPETHFPGNLEDCYAALAWLFGHAAELGVDASRIGVMGESAGGGLAAGLALLARDRGQYRLAFQHLIAPMLDDRTCTTRDPNPFTGQFIWTPESNEFGWTSLLGGPPGSANVSPYAAAARATDVSGLPQTFICMGALDLFLEEDLGYAHRLMRAGVPVELHVYPGAFHAFEIHATAQVAQAARRDSRAALRRVLRGGG